jgi:hypothetical protein
MHDRAMPSPTFGTSSRSRNGNFKTTPEYPHMSTHWQREWGYFFWLIRWHRGLGLIFGAILEVVGLGAFSIVVVT